MPKKKPPPSLTPPVRNESAITGTHWTLLGLVAIVALVAVVALVKPTRVDMSSGGDKGLKVGIEKQSAGIQP